MLSTPRLAVLFAAAVALVATGPAAADHHMGGDETHNHVAVCVLLPTIGNNVTGIIKFAEENGKLHVTGTVRGLTPGKHGFHVHEYGDISGLQDGKSTGGHFSPGGHDHGKPSDEAAKRHIGDLGNIEAGEDGVATIDITDDVIDLHGEHSIIGRAIVVHAGEDKYTQPTGDAGARVAIGVIGIAKDAAKTDEKPAAEKMEAAVKSEAAEAKAEMKEAAAKTEKAAEDAAAAVTEEAEEAGNAAKAEAKEMKRGAEDAASDAKQAAEATAAEVENEAKEAAAATEKAAKDAAESAENAVNEAAKEVEAATDDN